MWCDYKPEQTNLDRKYPPDLRKAYEYLLNLAKNKKLVVWRGFLSDRAKYREMYRKGKFPFNPDEPADLSDGAIGRAYKKKGIFPYLKYRVNKLFFLNDTEDNLTDPELAEAEYYYQGYSVLKKDLIHLVEKMEHKPLFLLSLKDRAGKKLREIWPASSTISSPPENKGKVPQPTPKKGVKQNPKGQKKKKKARKSKTASKPKVASKLKPPATPKKAPPAPNTGKGIKSAIHGKPTGIVQSEVSHSPDFRSMNVNGEKHSFTSKQASVIEYLYNNRAHEVSDSKLIEEFGLGSRLRDTFRKNAAWGNLIVSGKTKGTRRLNLAPQH